MLVLLMATVAKATLFVGTPAPGLCTGTRAAQHRLASEGKGNNVQK